MQEPARFMLMFAVFPLWVAAGFADWVFHRRTGLAHTSGLKENLLHLLMFTEIGLAAAAVALLEINAAVLLIVFLMFLAHQLTVYWDLNYSTLLRDVGPGEQMVHSFLEILPLLALVLLSQIAWPQTLALLGLGNEPAQWALRPKADPLPAEYLLGAGALALVFNILPLLQETWSCATASRRRQRAPAEKIEPRL